MLLRLLRFFRGWVSFTVSGKYPERFLNITARKNIRLWDVQRKDKTVRTTITIMRKNLKTAVVVSASCSYRRRRLLLPRCFS